MVKENINFKTKHKLLFLIDKSHLYMFMGYNVIDMCMQCGMIKSS